MQATHLFLSEAEIQKIKAYVPHRIDRRFSPAGGRKNARTAHVALYGDRGLVWKCCFFPRQSRGRKREGSLWNTGIRHYHLQELTVNEQNPQAVGFYRHMGLTYWRDKLR